MAEYYPSQRKQSKNASENSIFPCFSIRLHTILTCNILFMRLVFFFAEHILFSQCASVQMLRLWRMLNIKLEPFGLAIGLIPLVYLCFASIFRVSCCWLCASFFFLNVFRSMRFGSFYFILIAFGLDASQMYTTNTGTSVWNVYMAIQWSQSVENCILLCTHTHTNTAKKCRRVIKHNCEYLFGYTQIKTDIFPATTTTNTKLLLVPIHGDWYRGKI